MTLILLYLMVLILVSIVLFGIASLLFGRGEELPPLPSGTTVTVLPAIGVTAADVDAVKFTQVLRGYKTSEVDWVLDRLGTELEQLHAEVAALRGAAGLFEPAGRHRSAFEPGREPGREPVADPGREPDREPGREPVAE